MFVQKRSTTLTTVTSSTNNLLQIIMHSLFALILAAVPFAVVQAACPPTVNRATISLIKEFEGFVASPSPDPVGLPTVGYGHLCKTSSCSEAGPFPLTEARATTLLNNDLKAFTSCLNSAVSSSVKLSDNQFGALTSWTFNEGCGAMETSTLVKRLNAGDSPNTVAAQELPKWDLAGGQVLQGLVRRRAAEVKLFQTASSTIVHPC
jgi:GH24 family phage-related lysozyme (muramidase)